MKVNGKGIDYRFLLACDLFLIFVCLLLIFSYFKMQSEETIKPLKNVTYLYEAMNDTGEDDKYMIFKGNVVNNYVSFNNMLWRVVRVNSSGSITIMLEKPINKLFWKLGENFDILTYLNESFKNELDLDKLTLNTICQDNIINLENPTCDKIDYNYVSLLDLNSFVQTIDEGKSFVAPEGEIIWLENKVNDVYSWHTNGSKIGFSKDESIYSIKPVVTLKKDILYEKGNGTKKNPYLISSDKITIGSKVKLGDDLYDVIKTNGELKLMLNKNMVDEYVYNGDNKAIIGYVKDNYSNKNYKKALKNYEWETITINKGKIKSNKEKSIVGLPDLFDFKFDFGNFYLSTLIDKNIMVYSDPVIYGSRNFSHSLRPVVILNKEYEKRLVLKDGIYVLGDL